MAPEPEMIRQQIDETRSSLAEKLETLESEVKETVQTAKETVQETIGTVKETVQETVATVKRTFDLPYQTEQHPFLMVGLSFLGGVAVGALIGGRTDQVASGMASASRYPPGTPPREAWSSMSHAAPARPSFFDRLADRLGGEVDKVKELAVASLATLIHNVAEQAIPVLRENVERMVSDAAQRMTEPSPPPPESRYPSYPPRV